MSPASEARIRRVYFIAFLFALGVLAALIEPLASLGFSISNVLADSPIISRALAYLLLFLGAIKCRSVLIKSRVLRPRQAVTCYVALGFSMAGVYYLVQDTNHGCFQFPESQTSTPSIIDFVYFSFVTVTTVGYGDIVPRHTFVRGLVLLQVLFGLGLVSRLSYRGISGKVLDSEKT